VPSLFEQQVLNAECDKSVAGQETDFGQYKGDVVIGKLLCDPSDRGIRLDGSASEC
jgi:hypothetical protein